MFGVDVTLDWRVLIRFILLILIIGDGAVGGNTGGEKHAILIYYWLRFTQEKRNKYRIIYEYGYFDPFETAVVSLLMDELWGQTTWNMNGPSENGTTVLKKLQQ